MISILTLQQALMDSWSVDTAIGEWLAIVPALGQCAVTALVVQDYFGGKILRCPLGFGSSHYWNDTDVFGELDLTISQFGYVRDPLNYKKTIVRERDYILSFETTKMRYELLSSKVKIYLRLKDLGL